MLTVSCPGCGAPVAFTSHASAAAVCEFCRTTVVKDDAATRSGGRLSAVLEDYSPIQLGTSGVFAGRAFHVAGRIQLRWTAGLWNEWFLVFDDGGSGWLGDSAGRYVVTTARPPGPGWPAFDAIVPGRDYETGAGRCIAAEKRVARCIGGQGELPFVVGDGWEARVVDFRRGASFVTLDYSDGETPVLYAGSAVTLDSLQCQLLRDDEAIRASAGRYRGRLEQLQCPSCGGPLAWIPGVTSHLVCPSCRSELDASTPAVTVLKAADPVALHRFTLPLGSTGALAGRAWRVLGAMVRADDEGSRWTEYLLFEPRAGFQWLIETPDGWWRADVMDAWPEGGGNGVALDRIAYRHLYDYTARVELAAGAFNWRVSRGDSCRVSEFESGTTRLAAEFTPDELTWSRSTRVADDQVRAWFGLNRGAVPARPQPAAARASVRAQSRRFLIWLLCLNLVPLLFHFRGAAPWVFIGMLALALPPFFFDEDPRQ
jgi:ribosomal protein S27E